MISYPIDPEIGFTSDVIKDPKRFVGRREMVRDCIKALNSPLGLIAVFGKRGIGKSSLLRQIQLMALGDYSLAKHAGLEKEIPARPRKYLSVYYMCDSMIGSGDSLLSRLCNDQNDEDGLLRLVPNDGKDIIEFSRSKEVSAGADLKVVNWGAKGIETSKYARVVPGDITQTFRNFVNAIISHQVKKRMNRDGLIILLDEFDVIQDKSGLGSIIKSLSSSEIKFGVCGIGNDLADLINDHASVERLLEQGVVSVKPMNLPESIEIIDRAERLFENNIIFDPSVKHKIAELSCGYPYFTQLLGKECIAKLNIHKTHHVTEAIFSEVLNDVRNGRSFPRLESEYQRAIGDSSDRQLLLHLLAEQPEENTLFNDDIGRIFLLKARKEAEELDIHYVDQLLPRLIDRKFGPVLSRVTEKQGVYEFINPVFRLYVRMRQF